MSTNRRTQRSPKRPGRFFTVGSSLSLAWLVVLGFLAFFADYLPFIRYSSARVKAATGYKVGPGLDFWFGSDRDRKSTRLNSSH